MCGMKYYTARLIKINSISIITVKWSLIFISKNKFQTGKEYNMEENSNIIQTWKNDNSRKKIYKIPISCTLW